MGHAPPWYIKNAIPWFLLVLAWWWELACACLLAALLLSSHEGGLHVVHLSLCTDAVVCMLFSQGDWRHQRQAGSRQAALCCAPAKLCGRPPAGEPIMHVANCSCDIFPLPVTGGLPATDGKCLNHGTVVRPQPTVFMQSPCHQEQCSCVVLWSLRCAAGHGSCVSSVQRSLTDTVSASHFLPADADWPCAAQAYEHEPCHQQGRLWARISRPGQPLGRLQQGLQKWRHPQSL